VAGEQKKLMSSPGNESLKRSTLFCVFSDLAKNNPDPDLEDRRLNKYYSLKQNSLFLLLQSLDSYTTLTFFFYF